MYVKQFWKYFEKTGNIESYLDLKEYEKLYKEHTESTAMENAEMINENGLDGMK